MKRHVMAMAFAVAAAAHADAPAAPAPEKIDAEVQRLMASARANGLALALIEDGQVAYVKAYGKRNEQGDPLQPDTVMDGASLTKTVFAYTVAQLVDEGKVDLDASIERYLSQPLPSYPPWRSLDGDERWRKLTPRLLLSHRSGFANYTGLEPDGQLHIHFEPGSRYAYSGDGIMLLQFVLERGQGLVLGPEMQRRVFDRFGMRRSSMDWRLDFAANLADGVTASGKWIPHDKRGRVRAAGSMDTTIEDFARFAAGFMRGEGLSASVRADMTRAQWPITTARQFPTLTPELPPDKRRRDLAAGLGVVVFEGPQGPGFFKGGHNNGTGNTWVCLAKRRSCAVLLSNDVRAETVFPDLVRLLLGETGAPWDWEYGR